MTSVNNSQPYLYSTSRVFNVGSNAAIKYNNGTMLSDVEVQFPNIYFKDKVVREIMLSVSHCEVANSFYLVNATNNKLVINASTFTIPPGNYNAITFQTAITAFLAGLGITPSYSLITNKYTFTSGVAFTIQTTSTCQQFIGMGTTALTGTTVVSPHVLNFLPIPRLLFRSTSFNTSNFNAADGSNDLLLSVQNSSASGSQILWNNYSNLRYDITHVDSINVVNISVTDDYGNLIDFNGVDWYMTFRIEYLFEVPQNAISSFDQALTAAGAKFAGGAPLVLQDIPRSGITLPQNRILRGS